MKILIAIFHKDRVEYLNNLLQSVSKQLLIKPNQFRVIIFDGSEKISSIKYLKKVNKKFNIIYDNKKTNLNIGNLYISMNKSLQIAKKESFDYLITLQDDTQIVRKLFIQDFKNIVKIFRDQKVLCINPSFLRKINCCDFKNIILSKNKTYYINTKSSYADNAIFSVKKLTNMNFNFELTEDKLDRMYKKKFYLVYLTKPWFNHLPWSESSRKSIYDNFFFTRNIKRLLIKINSFGLSAGMNSISLFMNIDQFLNRNINILPTDELYLQSTSNLKEPWSYDPFWSFKKYKSFFNIIFLKWIFDGSEDYSALIKRIKKENLFNKKIFNIK